MRCFSFSVVTMAKGIGNGFPLAAVVTTPGKKCSEQQYGWRGMGLGGEVEGERVDYWLTSHIDA